MANETSYAADPAPALAGVPVPTRGLPDESASPGIRHHSARTVLGDWLTGSDPGLLRLRHAVKAVLMIGLTLAVEYWFVHVTHALQVPSPSGTVPASVAAQVAAQHHGVQVLAMLLGAVIGMVAALAVADPTGRGRLVSLLVMPVPLAATLTLGLYFGGHRLTSLIGIVVLLTVGTYLRRFGPRGFLAGAVLFVGGFFGFFVHGEVRFGQVGWLIAEAGIGVLVAIAVNLGPFYPRPAADLRRQQRSYDARARRLVTQVEDLVNTPTHHSDHEKTGRRLHRQLARLNESTLLIDAQLGDAASAPDGSTPALLHQQLFDLELALANLARFAEACTHHSLTVTERDHVHTVLRALGAADLPATKRAADALLHAATTRPTGGEATQLLLHRFGTTALGYVTARQAWLTLGASAPGQPQVGRRSAGAPGPEKTEQAKAAAAQAVEAFVPASLVMAGWLPGSALVSAKASRSTSTSTSAPAPSSAWGRLEAWARTPYTRTAIQVAVAETAAIALGDLLSPGRFYWAVIAAFVIFMSANNSTEQTRRAGQRVAGTVAGIVLGGLLAHAVGGNSDLALVVILVSLFIAFYLLRINYAFMVLSITVLVSQLYEQLHEYSDTLLLTRLEETAIGAGCAIAAVLLVLPLRARTVVGVAAAAHVAAIGDVVGVTSDVMAGTKRSDQLRAPLRRLDAAFHSLAATAQPLLNNRLRDSSLDPVAVIMTVATATRHYCRTLVADLGPWLSDEDGRDVSAAAQIMQHSIAELVQQLTDAGSPDRRTYTRSAALFERLDGRPNQDGANGAASTTDEGGADRVRLAVSDLQQLDGALAELATELGMTISDFDTASDNEAARTTVSRAPTPGTHVLRNHN